MKISAKRLAFFLAVVFTLLQSSASAQQSWDSTSRPDIYAARVQLFKAIPAGKKDIIFWGDSITFWGDWSELLGNKKYKNRGIPGDTSFGLLQLLHETMHQPEKVFIMIGINDLARGIPQEVIINNYKRILQYIRQHSPHTKVYFQSILPVNESFGKLNAHYKRAAEIPALNEFLHHWTAEQGVGYVNVYTAMCDEKGRLKEAYSWDGVHLTLAGYQQWIAVLKSNKLI